jgi:hypothetical protein
MGAGFGFGFGFGLIGGQFGRSWIQIFFQNLLSNTMMQISDESAHGYSSFRMRAHELCGQGLAHDSYAIRIDSLMNCSTWIVYKDSLGSYRSVNENYIQGLCIRIGT